MVRWKIQDDWIGLALGTKCGKGTAIVRPSMAHGWEARTKTRSGTAKRSHHRSERAAKRAALRRLGCGRA